MHHNTKMQIDFGGGIKTTGDVELVFNAGASFINIGSVAVKQPELVEEWIANNFQQQKYY